LLTHTRGNLIFHVMGEGGHPGAGHHSATSVTICECYLNMDLISAC